MAFEVPHKHDISLDGQEMRNQMIENFEAIEHEDQQDDQALVEEIQDRGDADKKLDDKIATEAQVRKTGDDSEARDRRAADEELKQRITKLEKIIFGQDPLEIKDTVPTKVESTAVEINDSLATQIFLE